MAFLGKAKKQVLILLAEELGQRVSDKMTNIDLRNIIIGSKDYEEEFVRAQLSVILEERFERESEEKIARQLAIEQQQREFELEKMRLEIERSRFDSENLSPLKTSVSDLIKNHSEFRHKGWRCRSFLLPCLRDERNVLE
ncbi:hypothetical protein TNCV_476001 [Trichonephila clavipes]|nr:hypothetical protein TNCV_476001 [Trichonephila clavipes]